MAQKRKFRITPKFIALLAALCVVFACAIFVSQEQKLNEIAEQEAALQAEYAKLQEQKETLYGDYGRLKKQVKEYDVINRNIDSILLRESEPERGKENVRG